MGQRLRLHPALVFIGVIGGLILSGIIVALIIVPVMATIGVFWRYFRLRKQGIDPFAEAKTILEKEALPVPVLSVPQNLDPIAIKNNSLPDDEVKRQEVE